MLTLYKAFWRAMLVRSFLSLPCALSEVKIPIFRGYLVEAIAVCDADLTPLRPSCLKFHSTAPKRCSWKRVYDFAHILNEKLSPHETELSPRSRVLVLE